MIVDINKIKFLLWIKENNNDEDDLIKQMYYNTLYYFNSYVWYNIETFFIKKEDDWTGNLIDVNKVPNELKNAIINYTVLLFNNYKENKKNIETWWIIKSETVNWDNVTYFSPNELNITWNNNWINNLSNIEEILKRFTLVTY